LGIEATNKTCIHEEINSRLNLGSAQSLLSSRLIPKNIEIKIYRNIILPVVLYVFKTLSLTIKKEHRLRVFENRMLRGIFGRKMEEVSGGWRRLHNEVHNLYASPHIIRVIKSRRARPNCCSV
jgi:hypothetical protein